MAKNNVKKTRNEISSQKGKLDKLNEQNMCRCPHTKRGDINVTPARNRSQGQLLYICKECEKDVDLTKIPEADLRNACSLVDRAIDTIKISLDMQNPHDQEILKDLAKVQYHVRNHIVPLYGKALSKQGTNRRNDHRSDGGNGVWMPPVADR